MVVSAFLVGLVVLAACGALCFWLAARYQRNCIARGVRSDRNYLKTMIAAGAGCIIMTFILIFFAFNPPPAAIDRMGR